MLTKLTVSPPNHTLPADLLLSIRDQSNRYLFDGCTTTHPCDIVAGQWDDDPDPEYVVLNNCGHTAKECQYFKVALFNRVSGSTWKQIASISAGGDIKDVTRENALLAAQEGRLIFSAAEYHCVAVGELFKVCDHWGKVKG